MTKLDITKPVQTRDGRLVRVLCTDASIPYGGGNQSIVGIIQEPTGQTPAWWFDDGRFSNRDGSEDDLINAPIKRRVTGWLNITPGFVWFYDTKEIADAAGKDGLIACVEIDIEYTEGQGLG